MKNFLKIVAAVLALFILIGITLNLYFTDERLKNTVMPYVNDAVGRTVEVESMSLTFFSTFPQPGISIRNMNIPGEAKTDTLLSLDELVTSVELFSLLGDQINISEIQLRNPKFSYVIHSDSSTNIDFLTEAEEADTDTSAGYGINIPYFQVTGGHFGYRDETSETTAKISNLNADITLNYTDLIESTLELQEANLSATVDGKNYVTNLPVSFNQHSTIDLSNETLKLEDGTLSIRGLNLNISGSITDWSNSLATDLKFTSSSDNFGELLRLVPTEYEQYTKDLNSQGSLSINGNIKGNMNSEQLPRFDLSMQVTDGYLKNPDLSQPIEQIQLILQANNDLATIKELSARAGENSISGSGRLSNPLQEEGDFSMDFDGTVNLATVSQFYDISQFDIEQMSGQLTLNGNAKGNRAVPEETTFDALATLNNGSLKYTEVPRPIENISVDAQASQSEITINNLAFEALKNTFSMKGIINQPLKEDQRTIDLNTDLRFDLATIKDFYPIDEDTLQMRGMLTANATLKGKADQIERSVQSGGLRLSNGFINHKSLGKEIRDITIESKLSGPTLSISKASFQTGNNNLSASGNISDYLSENRTIDLKITGNVTLSELTNYYDLNPTVTTLTGSAKLNLAASGPVADPAAMKFDGLFTAQNIHMDGEAFTEPVKELSGELNLSPTSADLNSLSFKLGSSDFILSGSLKEYMAYLKAEEDRKTISRLTGNYKSELLNLDELIDWEDTTATEPIPIHLPHLTSSVTAEISKLVVTGVTMNNLQAEARTTPNQIELEKATVELFDGDASGTFKWEVPQPDHTMITFAGSLDSLQAESFFREYQILGEKSKFHEYISGTFTANVDYYSELDVYLEPILETTTMEGDFGMTKSRLQGHPLQNKIADFLNTKEFRNIALDEWKSTYTLDNSILTIKDLRLTSGDIGAELQGTQHLTKGNIDYQMKLFLPERFKSAIASVITKQATEALTQDNGTIMVPLRITGTHENPKVAPDKEVIAPIIKKYLKNKAGKVLEDIFNGNN